MHPKIPILPHRLRQVPKKFNWLDHKLVQNEHLSHLDTESCTLYLFLLTVSDREGLSYYSDRRIRQLTPVRELELCRQKLISADLLAYAEGLYQILSLPETSPKKNTPQPLHLSPEKVESFPPKPLDQAMSFSNSSQLRHSREFLNSYLEKLR